MDERNVRARSASLSPAAGVISPSETVAKLIDVSSCIGCKACEVACQEWNDLPPAETRPSFGSYQTLPDLEPNFWQVIKFNEVERDSRFFWNMTKYQCMHCVDPGCLRACPAPGAIVQLKNGIVGFVYENCIGCGFCITGCPFDVPRLSPSTGKVYKCTLCSDRVSAGLEPACIKACPTNCLHFGTKEQLVRIATTRVNELKMDGYESAAIYDPEGVGGAQVFYVLPNGEQPEEYGLPRDPAISLAVLLWKQPLKWLGGLLMAGGVLAAFTHYLRFGRKDVEINELSQRERAEPVDES
ncbi:MAG TPA: formate dehydrogenase subunit beta [Acidobacteriota bacterium]|nr:formate dehydrogenase subunit beta [Acidobacteriota bacterium]